VIYDLPLLRADFGRAWLPANLEPADVAAAIDPVV